MAKSKSEGKGPSKPTGRHPKDYVAHGSDQHAVMLGLRKATTADKLELNGWTLNDITAYGPAARPEFLEATLAQKVNELETPPAMPQSEDVRKPNYAPPMHVPTGVQAGEAPAPEMS